MNKNHGQNQIKKSSAYAAIALALLAGSVFLSACNTVSGAGQDLKDASDATKRAITGDSSSDEHGETRDKK